MQRISIYTWISAVLVAASTIVGGLLASRIAFEWLFPAALWLGKSVPVLLLAGAITVLGLLLWRVLEGSLRTGGISSEQADEPRESRYPSPILASIPFMPWLAGLLYLSSPSISLLLSRLLFVGCAWLSLLFLARLLAKPGRWRGLGPLFVLAALIPIYALTLGQGVGTADTFEFQVVAPKLGIAHPTGYPLYLIGSRLFTFLPAGTAAWRVNIATAVFGLAAAVVIYRLVWRLLSRPLPAVWAAAAFGLTPTFWSQAVEAEVYTLHALIVASALLLMQSIGGWSVSPDDLSEDSSIVSTSSNDQRFLYQPFGKTLLLGLVLGLGMTNHLTTLILLPGAILTLWFAFRQGRFAYAPVQGIKAAGLILFSFLVPLFLYAYLPLRWLAINGEPMGFDRFIDWVIGGRFQGALQLSAWLKDTTRYTVVSRLIASEWQPSWLLLLSLGGALFLLLRSWRFGLILLITWLGYIFYALNYYVPDLSVFLIPAFLILAVWWGVGLGAFLEGLDQLLSRAGSTAGLSEQFHRSFSALLQAAIIGLVLLIIIQASADLWSSIDASQDDGRTSWGEAVLSLPLEEGAAILADSDKFPPLYYLQQVEGLRPDLEILLLPDEQAYRDALHERVNAGQPVYLARFVPGLEGLYHLGSLGPLTRVSTETWEEMPAGATPLSIVYDPMRLLGYVLDDDQSFGTGKVPITLYWSAAEPVNDVLQVYLRLAGPGVAASSLGQHPANNYYPTVAWEPGEIVPDFHLLDVPPAQDGDFQIEVAVAPAYTPAEQLEWQPIAAVKASADISPDAQPLRDQVGPVYLQGITFPERIRPLAEIPLVVSGQGELYENMQFELRPQSSAEPSSRNQRPVGTAPGPEFLYAPHLDSGEESGLFDLVVSYPGQGSVCGWLRPTSSSCILGEIDVSGIPLPESAHNFQDLIALTGIEVADYQLGPRDVLELGLNWLPLAEISEDYTVFVQLLDAQDQIVGQVDSWPLQGTFPTSQWEVGEPISDPYRLQIKQDLQPGSYRLHVGLYLLETLQRLFLVDDNGQAIDDKVELPGFFAR